MLFHSDASDILASLLDKVEVNLSAEHIAIVSCMCANYIHQMYS